MIIFDAITLMLTTLWAILTNPPVFYFLAGLVAASAIIFLIEVLRAPELPWHD